MFDNFVCILTCKEKYQGLLTPTTAAFQGVLSWKKCGIVNMWAQNTNNSWRVTDEGNHNKRTALNNAAAFII